MKARSIRLALAAALIAGCLTVPGCASKKFTPETPKTAAAMTADSVVVRVNELQAAVIEACGPAPECQPNSLPTATARTVVASLIEVRSVLKTTPDGWRASVKQAWVQTRAKLAGVTNPAILSAVALVNAAVEAL